MKGKDKIKQESATGKERPTLVAVPGMSSALHEGSICLSGSRLVDLQAAERFRILRARIERMNLTGSVKHVLAVTSAVPNEGKTIVSVNLARALSSDPRGKTIIVDCDLRKPSVHRYFNVGFSPGLSDVLAGNKKLTDVVQSVDGGLDILTAGTPVVDAARAVELPQLPIIIQELRKHYRYVIVDCPPVLLCPEPLTISSITDGTIMVVRAWRTGRKLTKDAVNLIGREKFLGVIINDASDTVNDYGYYGYYGYTYRLRGSGKNTGKSSSGGLLASGGSNGGSVKGEVKKMVSGSLRSITEVKTRLIGAFARRKLAT
jgi:capsular exopolysaccharide synthesis family protein